MNPFFNHIYIVLRFKVFESYKCNKKKKKTLYIFFWLLCSSSSIHLRLKWRAGQSWHRLIGCWISARGACILRWSYTNPENTVYYMITPRETGWQLLKVCGWSKNKQNSGDYHTCQSGTVQQFILYKCFWSKADILISVIKLLAGRKSCKYCTSYTNCSEFFTTLNTHLGK